MKVVIVDPRFEVFVPHPAEDLYVRIERAGRTSHRSEGPPEDREPFIRRLIAMGHESVLEHVAINAVIKTDRGVMAELTRHRVGVGFTISSTRYVRHDGDSAPFEVIRPPFPERVPFDEPGPRARYGANPANCGHRGERAMDEAAQNYLQLLCWGAPPELARSALPLCFASDIFMTGNVREWRLIFRQRTSEAAHPQMRSLMRDGLAQMKALYPVLFDDVEANG